MWTVEIIHRYTAVVIRLMYNTENEAKSAVESIVPYISKDIFELRKSNGDDHTVKTVSDIYGTHSVAMIEVSGVRCYDVDAWNRDGLRIKAQNNKLEEKFRSE